MITFDKRHGDKIAEVAGFLFNSSHDVVIANCNSVGELLGGVVYYDYTGRSISMHVAGFSPHWISRDMLWTTFNYPFNQLRCASIFCQLRSSNLKVLEFVRKVGFKREAIIEDVFPDGDLVIGRLRFEECRWINIKPHYLWR